MALVSLQLSAQGVAPPTVKVGLPMSFVKPRWHASEAHLPGGLDSVQVVTLPIIITSSLK